MLRFLTDELQDAEDAGDRGMHAPAKSLGIRQLTNVDSVDCGSCLVWMVRYSSLITYIDSTYTLHVRDGTNPLETPTNLCQWSCSCH